MADKQRALTKAQHSSIVKAVRAGTPRHEIAKEAGVPVSVVGKVACAAGLTNTREDVVANDKEIVKRWLANAGPAPRRRSS